MRRLLLLSRALVGGIGTLHGGRHLALNGRGLALSRARLLLLGQVVVNHGVRLAVIQVSTACLVCQCRCMRVAVLMLWHRTLISFASAPLSSQPLLRLGQHAIAGLGWLPTDMAAGVLLVLDIARAEEIRIILRYHSLGRSAIISVGSYGGRLLIHTGRFLGRCARLESILLLLLRYGQALI